MAQYNEPVSQAQLTQNLAGYGLSEEVQGQIEQYLSDAGDNIQVASWNGTATDLPEGQADVFIFNGPDNTEEGPTNIEIPDDILGSASVYVFDTDADVSTTFNTVDRVIVGGRGDNTFVVNGDHDTTIVGGDQTDTFTTTGGDDTFEVGTGETTIDAGEGFDVAILQGELADYDVEIVDGALVLTNASGSQLVSTTIETTDVEIIEFADNRGGLDLANHESISVTDNIITATVVRMYEGLLGRSAEAAGAQFWVEAEQNGASLEAIAQGFLGSLEYRATAANATNEQFVELLYSNALGRDGAASTDAGGVQYWLDALDNGFTRAQVAVGIVGSEDATEHTQDTIKIIDGLA